MTKRKPLTANQAREICMRQMAKGYVVHVGGNSYHLACAICKKRLDILSKMDRDHTQPLALGGKDDPSNQYFVHYECHKRKTKGDGATTYGSDIHAISKTKRLEKAREALERGDAPRPKKKIQGRGFDTRFKRRIDGTVVERTE